MDKFYLVKSSPDWADEITFEGFDLLSEDDYKNALKEFSKMDPDRSSDEICIGTNEETCTTAGEVLDDLKNAEEIDIDEYDFLYQKFGNHFGETNYSWWVGGREDEEYDDEEEEDE